MAFVILDCISIEGESCKTLINLDKMCTASEKEGLMKIYFDTFHCETKSSIQEILDKSFSLTPED